MKRIAIEEHFATDEYFNYLRSRKETPRRELIKDGEHHELEREWWGPSGYIESVPEHRNKILDIGDGRLKDMDESGIKMQVLSLTFPSVELFDVSDGIFWAKRTNDELFEVTQKYPERFAGFATLAPQDPVASVDELERAVKILGFSGVMINSYIGKGEYLDAPKYRPIFEKAVELAVPIYIHPKMPAPDMIQPYLAYPGLALAIWGFAADAGLHAMRLICSGVFDEYPDLKIILGHLGEALPYWLLRLDSQWKRNPLARQRKKTPSQYFKDNFFITTSGMFGQETLQYVISVLGADKILFAVDYPYELNTEAVHFMDTAPIVDSDREKIYHSNAEKLLKL
ncbi:amidohydrolase family protein [Chloroflexota bacterium]